MKRQTLGIVHQIMIGIGIAAVFVLVVEAIQSEHGGWSIESSNDDGSYAVSMRDGRDRLKVRSRGKIEFQDERRVARLESGARLRIEERIEGVKHKLVVTPQADGSPSYAYRVDGEDRAFDQAAEHWLAGVLIRVYRHTGLDAEARAQRIYDDSGIEGVLDEVTFISSDSVASQYLVHLIQTGDLSSAELQSVLSRAASNMDSDYYLGRLLNRVPAERLSSPGVLKTFAEAAERIDGDYQLRRLLSSVLTRLYELDTDPEPEIIDRLLGMAGDIDSDHEIAKLASELATHYPADVLLPDNLDPLLRSIDSDFSLRQAVSALLSRTTLKENQERLFAVAGEIASDHEAAELLIQFASEQTGGHDLPENAFNLLKVIDSDHSLGRAASALGAIATPSDLPQLLGAVSIANDFEAKTLLLTLIETHGAFDPSSPAFDRLLKSIDSDHEQRQVQEALSAAEARAGRRSQKTEKPEQPNKTHDTINNDADPESADPESLGREPEEPPSVEVEPVNLEPADLDDSELDDQLDDAELEKTRPDNVELENTAIGESGGEERAASPMRND